MPEKFSDSKKEPAIRLPTYFYRVNFTAFISSIFFLLLILFLPDYTGFVVERALFIKLMTILIIADGIFLYFSPILSKTRIFLAVYFKSILWLVTLTGILYALGGIKNYFSLVLIFPILSASFDLDVRATLYLGSITEILLLSLTLLDKRVSPTPEYYTIASSQIIFIGIFTFYLYSIIKEGVRHRFEKEEARRRYFDLVEVDRAKTEFMTIVSHRLFTPLSELRWAFDRVFEIKNWNKESADILKNSKESVTTLIGIVSELTQASDEEKENVTYRRVKIDVCELIEKALDELKDYIAVGGVKIEFLPNSSAPPMP